MQTKFTLSDVLKPLGQAQVYISYDFAAEIIVGAAGAAQGATSIPVSPSTTVPLRNGQVLYFGTLAKKAVVNADHAVGVSSITVTALATALVSGDKAYPWDFLGATEGETREDTEWTMNVLSAPEQTGQIPHQATTQLDRLDLVIPVIPGGQYFFTLTTPIGAKDGISDSFTAVKEKSLFLVPLTEVGTSLTYNGTTWTSAAPVHSLFFPRCYLRHGAVRRPFADGGKSIVEVTATPMYYASGPADKRVFVRGDPVAAGYSLFRF